MTSLVSSLTILWHQSDTFSLEHSSASKRNPVILLRTSFNIACNLFTLRIAFNEKQQQDAAVNELEIYLNILLDFVDKIYTSPAD